MSKKEELNFEELMVKLEDITNRLENEKLSLDDIVLETDSPYLSPEPFRGTTNSSKNIPFIAEKISQIKNVELEEVSMKTKENTYKLFDLK